MLKKLSVFVLLLSSMVLFGCNTKKEAPKENKNISATNVVNKDTDSSNKAPDFSMVDTKGKKITLSDYKGQVVLLDFWATWCPPCRRGIPDLIDLQKTYKGKLVVIGVSLDTDSKSQVVPFIKNVGINYPVVYGNENIVSDYGNIESIPTSFVIDQDGNIVKRHVGLMPKSVLKSEIETLLKKS